MNSLNTAAVQFHLHLVFLGFTLLLPKVSGRVPEESLAEVIREGRA